MSGPAMNGHHTRHCHVNTVGPLAKANNQHPLQETVSR